MGDSNSSDSTERLKAEEVEEAENDAEQDEKEGNKIVESTAMEEDSDDEKPAKKSTQKKESKSSGEDYETDSEKEDDDDDKSEQKDDDEEEEEENLIPPPKVEREQLHSNLNFAILCSFLNRFGVAAGIKHFSFEKLEASFTTYENNKTPRYLVDLYVQLMRRVRLQHANMGNWEKTLKKFLGLSVHRHHLLEQVESLGYVHIPIESKIEILKSLCDSQLDFNIKFRESLTSSYRTCDLRLLDCGSDFNGTSYWYQQDDDCNMRLYTEEDHNYENSGKAWKLMAKSAEELEEIIEKLKSENQDYDQKNDPMEKQKEKDIEAGKPLPIGYTVKRGSYFDTFMDEENLKKIRELVGKNKEERLMKINKNKEAKKEEPEESENEEAEETKEIPDELLEERRILPRRGASLRAASNLKKVLNPTKKPVEVKKKAAKEKAKSATPSEAEQDSDNDEMEDDDDEESDRVSSGDEFELPGDKRKRLAGKKRKRKAKKSGLKEKKNVEPDLEEEDESDDEEEKKERKVATSNSACHKCLKSTDWDVLLLCDCCDDAWHTYCAKPVLSEVPAGDWFCPKCHHGRLVARLVLIHEKLVEDLKVKAAEDKKKQAAADRLKREMEFIGLSFDNIINAPDVVKPEKSPSPEFDDGQRKCKRKAAKKLSQWNRKPEKVMPVYETGGRRSCRQRTKVDYKGEDYDHMIDEAVETIDGAPLQTPKPKREKKIGENGEELSGEDGEGASSEPKPKRAKKAKLNDLDAVADDDGSDNYKQSEDEASEEEFEAEENDSGSDFEDELPKSARRRQIAKQRASRSSKAAKRGKRRRRSWSASSSGESADEWKSESDSDDGYTKRRKRPKPVSEDEEEEIERTETGRPLRKAVVKTAEIKTKKVVISDSDDNKEESEDEDGSGDDSKSEFEIDEDDEKQEIEDEEDAEAMEEEDEEEESPDAEESRDGEDDEDSKQDAGSDSDGELVVKRPRMAGAPPSSSTVKLPVKKPVSAAKEAEKKDTKDDDEEEEEIADSPEETKVVEKQPAVAKSSADTSLVAPTITAEDEVTSTVAEMTPDPEASQPTSEASERAGSSEATASPKVPVVETPSEVSSNGNGESFEAVSADTSVRAVLMSRIGAGGRGGRGGGRKPAAAAATAATDATGEKKPPRRSNGKLATLAKKQQMREIEQRKREEAAHWAATHQPHPAMPPYPYGMSVNLIPHPLHHDPRDTVDNPYARAPNEYNTYIIDPYAPRMVSNPYIAAAQAAAAQPPVSVPTTNVYNPYGNTPSSEPSNGESPAPSSGTYLTL